MSRSMRVGKWHPDETEEEDEDPNEDFSEEEDEDPNEDFSEEEEEEVETKNIIVKLKNAENESTVKDEVCIEIERNIELRWLMIKYCDKVGMDYNNTKFMFNGARIRDTDTPLLLDMIDGDLIYVFPKIINQGVHGRTAFCYETLCIRMHKKRDIFLRFIRTEPLLCQLKRHFSNGKVGKHVSTCFVYNGLKLTELHTVDKLNMEEGDIIDAFNFNENSCSLSIITPFSQHVDLLMKNLNSKIHLRQNLANNNIKPSNFSVMADKGKETVFFGCKEQRKGPVTASTQQLFAEGEKAVDEPRQEPQPRLHEEPRSSLPRFRIKHLSHHLTSSSLRTRSLATDEVLETDSEDYGDDQVEKDSEDYSDDQAEEDSEFYDDESGWEAREPEWSSSFVNVKRAKSGRFEPYSQCLSRSGVVKKGKGVKDE